jgi:hypothetical protein
LNAASLINADTLGAGHLLSCGFLNPRSLCRLSLLDAGLLLNADTLSPCQFCSASRLNASCLPCADTLSSGEFTSLCRLAGEFCAAILTEHLSRLLKRLLGASGLNPRETIHQVALCERLLNCLTRSSESPSANRLRRTSATLLVELLNCTARLLIDHILHVRRHVFLNISTSKSLRWIELELIGTRCLELSEWRCLTSSKLRLLKLLERSCLLRLEPSKLRWLELREARSSKLEWLCLTGNLLASLNVSSCNTHSLRKASNPLTCGPAGYIICSRNIWRETRLTLPRKSLIPLQRLRLSALKEALEVWLRIFRDVSLSNGLASWCAAAAAAHFSASLYSSRVSWCVKKLRTSMLTLRM